MLAESPFCSLGRSFGMCRQNMLGAVDTRWYKRAAHLVWSDQENDEARGSKDRASQALTDHTVTRSMINSDVGMPLPFLELFCPIYKPFSDALWKRICNPSALFVYCLYYQNIGDSFNSGAKQSDVECH